MPPSGKIWLADKPNEHNTPVQVLKLNGHNVRKDDIMRMLLAEIFAYLLSTQSKIIRRPYHTIINKTSGDILTPKAF